MRIGVYGGSFDPPHVVHEAVARDAVKVFDELLVIPAFRHALKPDSYVASFNIRMAMTKAVFADDPRIIVSTEAQLLWNQWRSTYSYDLLTLLRMQQPKAEFVLLVGSDILFEAHKWHRWADIEAEFGIHVVGRSGSLPDGSQFAKTYPDVSATDIRRRLAAGEDVKHLVPEATHEFLHVYRKAA